jgi:hypothetical protein
MVSGSATGLLDIGRYSHHIEHRTYDPAVARGTPPLVPLGYGKYVRADRVYALVPLEGADRGDGRRTLVHVEGIEDPIVASRAEGAIARDVAAALGRGPRADAAILPGQEALF